MKTYSDGFTLLELMVTLAVSAVLAMIAAPSFDALLSSSARTAALTNINGDLRFARGGAVSKSRDVVICASADGSTCSASTTWDTGWIVFTDLNGNGAPDYGTGTCDTAEDCLLKSQSAMTGGVTLRADAAQLTFSNLGEVSSGATNLALCGANAESLNDSDNSRTLNINASGSIFVTMGTNTCP